MADDYAGSTSTTGTLSVGGSKVGNIETAGDTDWFKITLQAGYTYQFDMLGSPTSNGTLPDTYMRVRDSAGNSLALDDDSGTGLNSRISGFTAAYGGTYYVSAGSGTSTGTGTYTLTAIQTGTPTPTDDYAGSTSTTGTLSVGGSKVGNIETAGDTDWFKITLQAGYTYQFDMLGSPTSNGTLSDTYMRVRDSAGNSLALDDDSGTGLNSQISGFTATYGGTYYVSAGSGTSTGTGTYTLTAIQTGTPTPTDDYAGSTSTTGTLSVGGSKVGNIETAGDTDWFKITLQAGYTYQFDMLGSPTSNGTLSDTYMRVRDSAGNSLALDDDSGTGLNSQISGFTATYGGTYYVSAGSGTSTGTGTYTLTAIQTGTPTDNAGNTLATATVIAIGTTTNGTVGLGLDTDDYFKFVATADGRVTAGLTGLTADIDLRAYDMSGVQLAVSAAAGTANESLSFNVVAGQTYFLQVDPYLTSSSSYSVATSFAPTVTSGISVQYPFAGNFTVTQTATGTTSHTDDPTNATNPDFWTAAYDFSLPSGTPVLAAAGGTVVSVYEATANNQFGASHGLGNFITILHNPGTANQFYATYAHLSFNSVIPIVGQSVLVGERIALSGNTGNSTGPHLHFQFSAGYFSHYTSTSALPIIFSNSTDNFDNLINFGGVLPTLNQVVSGQFTGGPGNDVIIGNAAGNVIIGNGGDDSLVGLAGNDYIDGGLGNDTMEGGDGNDTYLVNSASDVVSETNAVLATGGNDTVNSLLATYTLGSNIENGRIMAAGTANLTGNGLNNMLIAGAGNNVLDGATGNDTASYAFAGSGVTVSLAVAGAQATGGAGSDTLISIENLIGSKFVDHLTGNGGGNRINGGLGSDVLAGGLGADAFVFNSTLGASNIDTITDYAVVDDTIWLDNALMAAIGVNGALAAGMFVANGTGTATSAGVHVIYDTSNGHLYYDADGNGAGAAQQIATLSTGLALTASDFLVI